MNKSITKENNCKTTLLESSKRRKIDCEMSENNLLKCVNNEDPENLSVTVYEDNDSDISFFNKSSKKRVISSSFSKRSPLTTINKTINQTSSQQDVSKPSSSKTPLKRSESTYKKLDVNEQNLVNPFELLSEEILLHIFQYLPKKTLHRVALVNTRFSRVILDESLWIRMDLGNRALKRGSIGKIFSRGFIILRLAQAKIQSPIFESHFRDQEFQSKLQYLDLSLASIDVTSLAQLLKTCHSLKKLSLEHVPVDINVCKEIAECRDLEVLNLAMCEGLNQESVIILMANLQSLTALNISWTNLSSESVEAIVSLITPSIMRFNISGCRRSLTDISLQIFINRCPNIVELDLSDCTLLTSVAIQAVTALTKLEYLSLSRCYNIPMTSYLVLNNVKSLLFLDVFNLLSDAGLQMLEKTFKNIGINKFIHSSVARPTVMPRRTSIWGLRTRD
ncbi:unnamed protein product [Chironomus riparius]|uniref:F-box domain-containing protein n=1 Tax=Chironomus riparius TaxID=315576 RepID=A0A9N9RLB6_9DIPT|nr:unnamed protein product [Chironomus riparius]